jgi:Undecaprenyl-phosphate galactose phosphotransferase WbaP
LDIPTLALSDILFAALCWGFALVLYSIWGQGPLVTAPIILIAWVTTPIILGATIAWIGMRMLLGLYPGYGLSSVEELRRQTYATVATLALVGIFSLALHVGDLLSRLLIGLIFLELLLLAPPGRYFVKWGLTKLGVWGKPVVILGAGETGKQLVRTLRREWELGFRPVAVFDFRLAPRGGLLEGEPYGGTVADALVLARKRRVDTVIFAMPHIRREYLAELVDRASLSFRQVIFIPNLVGITNSAGVARDFAGTFGVEIKHNLLAPWPRRVKRALDLFGVIVGGLLLCPLLLIIAALIKLNSPGPVFHKQRRPGVGGKYFDLWKFRTMSADAEQLLIKLLQSDPNRRAEWEKDHKLRDDPRITRVGRFLRKTSLDELPQLWNVLRGEMSLVGPRPALVEEVSKYGEVYGLYQRMRPGITGLWQVSGRNDTSYEERLAMISYYVHNWSIWLDLIILARTVQVVVFRGGTF